MRFNYYFIKDYYNYFGMLHFSHRFISYCFRYFMTPNVLPSQASIIDAKSYDVPGFIPLVIAFGISF